MLGQRPYGARWLALVARGTVVTAGAVGLLRYAV